MDKQNKSQNQYQNRQQNQNSQNKKQNQAENKKQNWLKVTDMRSPYDPLGSYTGVPTQVSRYPRQDADDL